MEIRSLCPLLLSVLAVIGCSVADDGELAAEKNPAAPPQAGAPAGDDDGVDAIARRYVELALAVGQHDLDFVDAYYGPREWHDRVAGEARSLAQIRAEGEALVAELDGLADDPGSGEDLKALRRRYLRRQLGALVSRVDMLTGERWTFDTESRALYDAVAPTFGDEYFAALLDDLDRFLREQSLRRGSIAKRYERFRRGFVIPPDRLDAVFRAAIDACRERTLRHLDLPPGESFELEYVRDKPWSGYNWYLGDFQSLIQINLDLPIYIDRAIDLACHEGYPGHHTYNALLEKHLVRDRGWVEVSVYPLFSPQSLIAEGSANYGIEMAFPAGERLEIERDVLYPLAGIDPSRAASYALAQGLVERLSYADNEAARRYLDGEFDREDAEDWLVRYTLRSRERAEQRVDFFDKYRAYVINYNLGEDMVRAWVQRHPREQRWQAFGRLLSSPRLPSGLVADEGLGG